MRSEFQVRAEELDRADRLRPIRDRFYIPRDSAGAEIVYLVGNSLGLQPKSVASFVAAELERWKNLAVAGHFEGDEPWLTIHERVRGPIAGLVGGLPHEVVVMNSLTVNLHLMLATFFQPSPTRTDVVIEANAFPSDQYAVASQLRFHGLDPDKNAIKLTPRKGEHVLRTGDVIQRLEQEADHVALVLLGGLNYYTGQVLDMQAISDAARRLEIPIGFDLAHAVGNVPLRLHEWECDFAVWCSYKYLNAGPGAIAGCFIHERCARDRSMFRLAGWWGHEPATRFEMPSVFQPAPSADGWQISGPAILQMAALRSSLEIFEEVGFAALREKSLRLSAFLREILEDIGGPFRVITPSEPGSFGCQLSLLFDFDAQDVCKTLESGGVACDYREPNVIRIAAVPLYNSFDDLVRFGAILEKSLA